MKSYSDNTLKTMTKDELIKHIRMLEHNLDYKDVTINDQYNLLERLTKNMSNEEFDKLRK